MKDATPKNWPHNIPENTVIYAIGDLHGHLEQQKQIYTLIEIEASKTPKKNHVVIFLGDYVDRGPDSAQVIERLIMLKESGSNIQHHFLMGNHERGFLGFLLENVHDWSDWLVYGGIETAESYGVSFNKRVVLPAEYEALQMNLKKQVPEHHIAFLETLKDMIIYGDYAFVHAGIRPNVPLNKQKPSDLRFIREPFLSWEEPLEKCIVHGHTITKDPVIKTNRIGLDTGLYQNHVLTCGIFEQNSVKLLQIKK